MLYLGITILLSLSVFQLIVAGMVPATSLAVPLVGKHCLAIIIYMYIPSTYTLHNGPLLKIEDNKQGI